MNLTLKSILSIISISFIMGCNSPEKSDTIRSETKLKNIVKPTNKIGLSRDIEFIHLNPKRGDKAPQAGAIYGNIREDVPTGYIGKFKNGFSSPPHIHNVTYRAIVMNGELHNADEKAPKMWMPAGSAWTQPKGQAHITAARGENAMAYIEIDSGPYLVWPVAKTFDSKERPINIDASNMIYLGSDESQWIADNCDAEIAYLWEKENGENGYLIKMPIGFTGHIQSDGDIFFGLIINGNINYTLPNSDSSSKLDQGSHFQSKGNSLHDISTNEASIVYIRTNGSFIISNSQ